MRTIPRALLANSRILRKKQTPWEAILWQHLRAHRFYSLQFKRQVQIGKFIVDFCCRGKKVIIELDGGGHSESLIKSKDQERQKFLESQGYKVLRFWNNELYENIEGVLEVIRQAII